jgi:DNA repair protein RadA/Sms
MKIKDTSFVCSNCGNEFNKWQGQCPACGEWNSLKEAPKLQNIMSGKSSGGRNSISNTKVINLGDISFENDNLNSYISTNIREFDRVLGKGIVRGSLILLAGEPGVGKSTLVTQAAINLMTDKKVLYVDGEETASQVALRVNRLGGKQEKIDVLETNNLDDLEAMEQRVKDLYDLVLVDSVQVMRAEGVGGMAGSPSQIREVTLRLLKLAKSSGVAIILLGHVTKEGEIAGPKMLEHMVDVVLYFEGEKNTELRILHGTKNRFGAADEVGVFRMGEKGLVEMGGDKINLTEDGLGVGSGVSVVMEGSRPMSIEVQALVTESFSPAPRRVFSGIDFNRGQILVAVAQKVLGIPLYKFDVVVAVAGGIRISDTGADLAIVGAIYSSYRNKAIGGKSGVVLVGEVSLLGGVKKVRNMEKRKSEARAMGRELVEVTKIGEIKRFLAE